MKVLVAPLDWGLGHATRTVPVIREFLFHGAKVDLAVSGKMSAFFRGEFPELSQVEIPGYEIRYPGRGVEMPLWLLKNYRRILDVIRTEHLVAESLVQKSGYDIIVSDNRFGFYSEKSRNIYMTHQMRIAFPGPFSAFEKIGIAWHKRRMERFDEVWIPDFPELPGLAGKLSHVTYSDKSFEGKIRFIGPQSRFLNCSAYKLTKPDDSKRFRFLSVLSGPEPMRSSFEKKVLCALSQIPGNHAVILGRPGEKALPAVPPNISVFNHLESEDFVKAVLDAGTILSRPGYSTVMDMANLGANCVFVPTPGQTEQEFLGRELFRSGQAGLLSEPLLLPDNLCKMEKDRRKIRCKSREKNLLSFAVDSLF